MPNRKLILSLALVPVLCLLAVGAYFLPPVHSRLDWRVRSLITQVRYALNPPEQVVFVPEGSDSSSGGQAGIQATIEAIVQATIQQVAANAATPTAGVVVTEESAHPAATALPAETPTSLPPAPTPLPEQILLNGVRHEYQKMNNCGPATLAMGLSYWGWEGDQLVTRASLRPNFDRVDDKNVNPWEMEEFVQSQAGYHALARVGGDLPLLKRLLAAGFPVIVEKGFQPHNEDWMGHFELLTGYDDGQGRFFAQDSYIGPDIAIPYADLDGPWWRDFNYAYVVIFPVEREAEVLALLGTHADPQENYRLALEKAQAEISSLSGRDLFFAYYNLGSNLIGLGDYAGAAQAYDQAWAVYPNIPEEDRPWRVLWYMDGPYAAYFHTGRYQDVLNLGNQTLNNAGGPVLEETFYWLGRAREAIGDLEKAVYDYQKAVEINPGSTPARQELQRLGY